MKCLSYIWCILYTQVNDMGGTGTFSPCCLRFHVTLSTSPSYPLCLHHSISHTLSLSLSFPLSLFLSSSLPSLKMAPSLRECWHQMYSSSVGSETSWAESASSSVNENGSTVCACVCVCVCVAFSGKEACDGTGGLSGWGLTERPTVSHIADRDKPNQQRSTAQPRSPNDTAARLNCLTSLNALLSTSHTAQCLPVSHAISLSFSVSHILPLSFSCVIILSIGLLSRDGQTWLITNYSPETKM